MYDGNGLMRMDTEALITGRTDADTRETRPASHSAHITSHYTLKSIHSVAYGPELLTCSRHDWSDWLLNLMKDIQVRSPYSLMSGD